MNYTEETQAAGERFAGRLAPYNRLFARFAGATLFLLSSFPLGAFWFVVLTGLLSAGIALTIVWVGLPILVLAMLACSLGAFIERWRLGALLGARLPSPYRPLPRGSVFTRMRVRATDLAFWRALLYLFLLFPAGLVELSSPSFSRRPWPPTRCGSGRCPPVRAYSGPASPLTPCPRLWSSCSPAS